MRPVDLARGHGLSSLLTQVRAAGGVEPPTATLGEWRTRLTMRGHAMLTGAAELDTYLRDFPQSQAL